MGSKIILAQGEKGNLEEQGEGIEIHEAAGCSPQVSTFPADPPYISDAKSTGVPVGQKGILLCEASAVPSADFQWYKDDKR